jgi:hypothetical protein
MVHKCRQSVAIYAELERPNSDTEKAPDEWSAWEFGLRSHKHPFFASV